MSQKGVAIVTGASYGIGSDISKQLAAKGWKVAMLARSIEKLESLAVIIRQENGSCLPVKCDITDKDQVSEAVAQVEKELGEVDVLVSNAAYVAPLHKFVEGDVSEWERMINVNVLGALYTTRTVIPNMVKRNKGKIVFVSSMAGVNPTPNLAVHSGTKHMIEGVAAALRNEVADTGVGITVVRPGGVATPGYDHAVTSCAKEGGEVPKWIPTNSSNCLAPEVVASVIVNAVEMMDVAELTDINIANSKFKK